MSGPLAARFNLATGILRGFPPPQADSRAKPQTFGRRLVGHYAAAGL